MAKKKISLTKSQADVQPVKSNIMTNCQDCVRIPTSFLRGEQGVKVHAGLSGRKGVGGIARYKILLQVGIAVTVPPNKGATSIRCGDNGHTFSN